VEVALAEALAEARHRAAEYRRWWIVQEAGVEPPWSASDDAAVARLESVDPWWLRSVADELDRVRSLVLEASAALAGLAAGDGPAAAVCARLGAGAEERAGALTALAAGVRASAERAAETVEQMARRALATGRHPTGTGEEWHHRHADLLRGLRDGLSGAVATWCPGDTGCPDTPGPWRPGEPGGNWSNGESAGEPSGQRLAGEPSCGESAGEPSGHRLPSDPDDGWSPGVVSAGEPGTRWLPGDPARPVLPGGSASASHPAVARVEDGVGVQLPDTGGRRPGPERGVRVAWLPDPPSRPGH
jgi:hypothetical protein